MLITQTIADLLNEQIGNEFSAMMQYTAIAAHFDGETLPELSRFFSHQAEEEKAHAHRIIKYAVDTGTRVRIPDVPAPQAEFQFAEEAVKISLEQEKKVTAQINHIVHVAKSESDYMTDNFLQWFVEEQLEEVASMEALLSIVQRAGEGNLLRVEDHLARKRAGNVADRSTGDGG